MKKIALFYIFLPLFGLSQQLTTHTWTFGGQQRSYKMYVPAAYSGSIPVPVVFCLHGLGDNMNNFTGIGMNFVADTANFIVVTPQARIDPNFNTSAWNSGASYGALALNPNVDDVGFLGAIIDTLVATMNIDQNRIYSCGFSMGGFMTNRLGCEMNNRIAAIASVAGTIGNLLNCQPGKAVPACHFHGTADGTVSYSGNTFGNDAEDLALFWASNNNCTAAPVMTLLPDIATDNYMVTHTLYSACDYGADVALFRVDSADHIWLTPSNDIFYTTEIWKFLSRYTLANYSITKENQSNLLMKLFPNPTDGMVTIDLESMPQNVKLSVIGLLGNVVFRNNIENKRTKLNFGFLSSGTYFVNVKGNENQTIQKLIIQ